MDNYLVDRGTLGKFIDELMAQKSLPERSAEEAEKYREEKMGELNRKIGLKIVDALDDEQFAKFDKLLDRDESPEAYRAFFKGAGLDIENIIAEAMREFGEDYLGGRNA